MAARRTRAAAWAGVAALFDELDTETERCSSAGFTRRGNEWVAPADIELAQRDLRRAGECQRIENTNQNLPEDRSCTQLIVSRRHWQIATHKGTEARQHSQANPYQGPRRIGIGETSASTEREFVDAEPFDSELQC
jgi:hypothetical protein